MSPSKVYLITGANRGIGLALVDELVSKHPEAIVFAGARDPLKATGLKELASKYPGKIEIVKFVAGDVASNQALAKQIKEKYGRVDVVVANAGISTYLGSAAETPIETFREHFEVNVTGVLILFQAVYDLLKASASPKFVPITSGIASLTAYISLPIGNAAYGVSKAGLNWLSRKIHFENEWLTCFPLAPGIVDTDMAKENRALDSTGKLGLLQDAIQVTPAEAGTALVNIIEGSTREKDGGEFINVDGSKIAW
ncbi:NAD(P)-binding protein [Flammula alnicola]|nr:NAD(P)-binding protein [Flammula alnicola]